MTTLYENYTESSSGGGANAATTTRVGQSFTPQLSYTITSVKLNMYKIGSPGTLTVYIKATDGAGKPTSSVLASGTYNANTITDGHPPEWIEISLGAGVLLTSGIKYALYYKLSNPDVNNSTRHTADETSPTYTGGSFISSTDGGSSWTVSASVDLLFETWGNASSAYFTPAGPDTTMVKKLVAAANNKIWYENI